MKQHAAIAIAALMILSSMALAVQVSATHEPTVGIDEDLVKDNTSMVRTITITNAGPDAIKTVRIILPVEFDPAWIAPIIRMFKGDNVLLGDNEPTGAENNIVILPAGTIVELTDLRFTALENTRVIIVENAVIYWCPVGDVGRQAKLLENLEAKIQSTKGIENTISEPENFEMADDTEESICDILTGLTVKLVNDTLAVRGEENVVRLPEDTLVQLIDPAIGWSLRASDNIKTIGELPITVDNLENVDDKEETRDNFVALSGATTGTIYNVVPGDKNIAVCSGEVVIPPGEVLQVTTPGTAKLFAGENVIRAAGENVTTTATTENQPKDWEQYHSSSTLPSGYYVEWTGELAKESLKFPFALKTPTAAGDYTIYVRTTDAKGATVQRAVTLTVDNTLPEITVTASPELVGAEMKVTITVESDKPLAGIENVLVAENAVENTEATFVSVSADEKTWIYTYTTGDNAKRDGTAIISVVSAEDLVGHENDGAGEFTVDRILPLTPLIEGFPELRTNVGTWLLEGIAQDNTTGAIAEGTVKIRVGTMVYEVTTDTSGYWSKSITLTEGVQEVGVRYVDLAGNIGPENAENITYDATPPSISIISPENGAYINDTTPTIRLTIADDVMGIENKDLHGENYGYSVLLCYDENDAPVGDNLTPKTYPASDLFKSFTFENDWPTELENEVWYRVYVVAGDNLQAENIYIRFYVDITAPAPPTTEAALNPLDKTSLGNPAILKTTDVTISGRAEEDATIKVYVDGIEQTAARTTATGGSWDITVSLTGGAASKVEVTATDAAGNESGKRLLGFAMPDTSAPTVTITSPADGTETTEKSIMIEGTVTKDKWEDWSDIKVTVQVGAVAGATVTPDSTGHFRTSAALTEGTNTIVVVAEDAIGNRDSKGITSSLVTRVVTPWTTYAAITLVVIALILAAIAIFRKR